MSAVPAHMRRAGLARAGRRCEYCGLSQAGQEAREAHRHAVVRELLDLTARKTPRAVGVNQQPEHHRGRVLGAAGAALVGLSHAEVQQADGVHHEVHQVICGDPVSEVRRKEQRSIVVDGDKTCGHPLP